MSSGKQWEKSQAEKFKTEYYFKTNAVYYSCAYALTLYIFGVDLPLFVEHYYKRYNLEILKRMSLFTTCFRNNFAGWPFLLFCGLHVLGCLCLTVPYLLVILVQTL